MIVYEAINLINNKRYIGQTTRSLNERRIEHIKTSKRNVNVSLHFYRALNKYGIENFCWKIIDRADTQDDLNIKESFWIEFFNTTNIKYGYNLKGGGYKPFLTEEVKRKIGDAQKGELNHMFGIYGSENPSSKRVININTQEIFDSVTDLCKKYPKFDVSKVSAVCRGDRITTLGYTFRYLDENNNIIDNENEINIVYLMNYQTGEKFLKPIDAFKKYKKSGQDKSTLYALLKKNHGVCIWNDYIWYYTNIDVSKVDLNKLKDKPIYNNKPVKNITTSEYFLRIQDATKNSCNLATKLRKNNGHCFYKGYEWELVK